jgi:hypothetical protein
MLNAKSPDSYQYLRCYFIVLTLITVNNIAYSQNKVGVVVGDSKLLSGAIVKNLSLGLLTISGDQGAFTLKVNNGDTILTNSLGFKTDTLIYHEQSSLLIVLKPLSNILNEVIIREFKINPLEKFRKNQDDYKQIYRIGNDKNWFTPMIGPFSGIAINIDAFYSHFSRAGKNARKLQKTLITDYYADLVDSRFTKELVTKYSGYEGQQLDNFMIDYRPTYDFIKYASDYDLIKYIQQKSGKNTATKDTTLITHR